jgi:hypothetical protein
MTMTRHIIDHRKTSQGGRTRAFLSLDRANPDRLHPATRTLHQRRRTDASGKGLAQFLRIARGHPA